MKKAAFFLIFFTLISSLSLAKSPKRATKKQLISISVDSSLQRIRWKQEMHTLKHLPGDYGEDDFLNTEDAGESTGGGYFSAEELSSELYIDSVWSELSDYYTVWDSRKVNPYGMEGDKFKDTVNIPLYYPLRESWSLPILEATHITSGFGMRSYRWHYGTDLKLEMGDTVCAVFDGVIRICSYDRKGYGNYVLVRHSNGLETLYGHLKKSLVEVGQHVKAGDLIGWGGNTGRSTGSHLHFEVRYQGNAIDPEYLFDFKKDTLIAHEFILTPQHFEYIRELKKVRFHKIKKGDSLYTISRKYHISIPAICRLNRMTKKTTLLPGKKIRIN